MIDIVIIFSKAEDEATCAGYLYRKGAAYEEAYYKRHPYIVVQDASDEIIDNFSRKDIFLEYSGQEKIGIFRNEKAKAHKFMSNCESEDLPTVEDVYDVCLTTRKSRTFNNESEIDIYVFGQSDDTFQLIEKIDPQLVKDVQNTIRDHEAIGIKNTIGCIYTAFNYGWNTKYICVITEQLNKDRSSKNQFSKILKGIKNLSLNMSYKHAPAIKLYCKTIPLEENDILDVVSSIYTDAREAVCTFAEEE